MAEIDKAAVARAIELAAVPHTGGSIFDPEGKSSRSLGYYASVGIDYFKHDHARYERLLELAADAAIANVLAQLEPPTSATPQP